MGFEILTNQPTTPPVEKTRNDNLPKGLYLCLHFKYKQ